MKKALSFKKRKFQGGGTVGGGYTTVTLTPDIEVSPSVFSTFKMYETAQLPTIDKSKLKPQLDLDKLKGHRNEVGQIYKKKEQLDKELASLSELDILGNSERFQSVMSQYNQLLSPRMINELAVSKEYSEKAYAAAEKKGTMGEVNVKDGKFMMRAGNGSVAEVPLDKVDAYLQNGFNFMTTGELFHERDTNENLAFGHQVDNRLSYGVAADELRKRFREQLAVGSNETGSKGEGYRLVKKVIDDVGTTDVFEESAGGGKKIKKNYEQLEYALSGIISSMSQEEKDTLTGLVTRRLANSRTPITSENISNEMYAYLLGLKESKKEYSELQESFTRLGTRVTGSASGSGSSQPKVEIGAGAMSLMGMGVVDNRTLMKGNTKIELRGTQIPALEELKTGTGDNERYLTLAETKKLRNMVDISNMRLMNGAKVGASEFVVNPNEPQTVTFAYRGRNGEYLIGNEAAQKANAEFEAAAKDFISKNPGATPQQFEAFKTAASQQLLKAYNVEQVVVMNGWIPRNDSYLTNMKDGVEYTEIDDSENTLVDRAMTQNQAKGKVSWYNKIGNDNYVNTQVIMPAAPMSTVRTMVDGDKVYTKATGLGDQGSLAAMEQTPIDSGRGFLGFDFNSFNNK